MTAVLAPAPVRRSPLAGKAELGLAALLLALGAFLLVETQRIAALAHAGAAVVIILIWITHVYASIWIQGTMRAMTRGEVTAGWAYRHHRKWLKQLAGLRRKAPPRQNPAE